MPSFSLFIYWFMISDFVRAVKVMYFCALFVLSITFLPYVKINKPKAFAFRAAWHFFFQ